MNEEPKETEISSLKQELAHMHGVMFNLITALFKTQLSPTQSALVSAADVELAVSQKRTRGHNTLSSPTMLSTSLSNQIPKDS